MQGLEMGGLDGWPHVIWTHLWHDFETTGYGYGIRYDYGIFHQVIKDGYQTEESDNWMRRGNPWEIKRRVSLYKISFFGRSEAYTEKKVVHVTDG